MFEFECPHCHLPLRVDEPDYKRVVCAHCRQILDVPQPLQESANSSALELSQPEIISADPKPRASKSSARSPAQKPATVIGSGARHATLKNRPRPAAPRRSVAKTIGFAAALLLLASLTAFAITRALSSTQAVASVDPSRKIASAAPETDTQQKPPRTDNNTAAKNADALLSPQELEKRAVTPEVAKAAEPIAPPVPPVTPPASLKPEPAPQAASEPAPVAPEPVAPVPQADPTPQTADVAPAAPERNLNDLLNTRTNRGKKSDDEEAIAEAEVAAREAKMAAEKPKAESKEPEDSRVKFKPDNPFAVKEEPETAKSGAGKMETGAAKSAAAEATKAKIPTLPELPDVCAGCMGTGYVPVMAPRRLVRGLKDAVPPAALLAPWKQCPKCKAGTEDKALADAEASRMKDPQTLATHEHWAQMVNGKLESVETRHVSVRSQLSAAQNKVVGDALEQLTEHLQRHSKLTILTPTRPDTHELFLFSDRTAFETIRDSVGSNPDFDKAQLAKISGVSMRNKGLYHLQAQQKPENMALFLFGRMTMTEVTNGKGPFWLVEGFAAYCENTVMKKNLCYSITYEVNDVKFSPNWDDDIRKFAAKRQLKPWKEIFPATGMLMKPLEYLTCYSMVSFLIKTDPQRFSKLVIAIREGHESPIALKMAYGRDVDELQRLWAMWALTAK